MPGQRPHRAGICALALCELLAGPFEVLRVVIAYERGEPVSSSMLNGVPLNTAYLQAAAWAEEAGRALR